MGLAQSEEWLKEDVFSSGPEVKGTMKSTDPRETILSTTPKLGWEASDETQASWYRDCSLVGTEGPGNPVRAPYPQKSEIPVILDLNALDKKILYFKYTYVIVILIIWIFFLKIISCIFYFLNFIYLFLERGREKEREGQKHQCVVAFHTPPPGDLSCKPGMCPDWESNQQLFDSQASTQSTEPHQPGP